jgi:hypothetical protein
MLGGLSESDIYVCLEHDTILEEMMGKIYIAVLVY